ncbi:MAG TPA: hypothetical protein VL282_19615, partial [Tepidisphaeraceae bacterium]|nr:hypothetical protein [Tepidisphaeraceae bacterium]
MKLRLALLVGGCFAVRASAQLFAPAPAQLPTTAASNAIVEVQLEDPTKSESKTYLDFDHDKTFTYGESTPEDLDFSRRWLKEKGVDFMCESRSPADGFVAYDMTLVETDEKLEEIVDYAAVSRKLKSSEAQPFNAVSVGVALPKTYLFRTREGEVGALEISSIAQKPSGLQLRYRLIHEPVPEQPPRNDRRMRAVPV